jgi:hypothetical protein
VPTIGPSFSSPFKRFSAFAHKAKLSAVIPNANIDNLLYLVVSEIPHRLLSEMDEENLLISVINLR